MSKIEDLKKAYDGHADHTSCIYIPSDDFSFRMNLKKNVEKTLIFWKPVKA
ncbi:MAG: hypothetical protein KKF44_01665 [Nanoarchaeota archaeon]|nr:hypothetical protein [Nanoarchaeota archaeon]